MAMTRRDRWVEWNLCSYILKTYIVFVNVLVRSRSGIAVHGTVFRVIQGSFIAQATKILLNAATHMVTNTHVIKTLLACTHTR